MKIRKASFAGSFYPEDPLELRALVDGFITSSKSVSLPKGAKLKAIMVPHAGYVYSGIVAASGYKLLKSLRALREVIIIGPSHNKYFRGAVVDDSDYWETPLGKVRLDKLDEFGKFGEAHKHEHSLEVQIPFLQRVLKDFEILPIMYGEIDPENLANDLMKINTDMIVVSSDLSHYYPYEEAVRIDRAANEAIPSLDIERAEREVEACGKTGILATMQMAVKMGWKGIFIDYRNSGDTAGDRDRVVGYGCYGFYE